MNKLVLAAIVATAAARVLPENPASQRYLWEQFKTSHNKRYDSVEEDVKRFGYFLENLKTADLRNAAELKAGGSALHGITKFSDMSQAEFEAVMLKADPSLRSTSAEKVSVNANVTASLLVDWEGIYTTPVKDQGYCGSCWAFSATEQIESEAIRQLGVTYLLSPEQITQCAKQAYGCQGGWTEVAYNYVQTAGGLETEADYPYVSYVGITGRCSDVGTKYVTLSQYYTLTNEVDMAAFVQSTGPLSVCLDANNWNSYTGGIMSVCGTSVDHCVQAVGVLPDADTGYWKVRNSWGVSWGESGHIRLKYGANTCLLTNDPTYVAVKLV